MKLDYEILFNKYGQGIVSVESLVELFLDADIKEQAIFFEYLLFLILQSKATNQDIPNAINDSGLKSTYTPCVMLKKGTDANNLLKITQLPNNESIKSFRLLLELFKISYKRKFEVEKNNPNKWWYWDLSNPRLEKIVYENFSKMKDKTSR